jgi:4-hydroxy-4-methyl-2-oxoglutarate aldolase
MKVVSIFIIVFFLTDLKVNAQSIGSSPEYIKALTADWKGDRFPDGRPKVSDDLLERLKSLTLEEVWAELIDLGYPNQYEGNWQLINESGVDGHDRSSSDCPIYALKT